MCVDLNFVYDDFYWWEIVYDLTLSNGGGLISIKLDHKQSPDERGFKS